MFMSLTKLYEKYSMRMAWSPSVCSQTSDQQWEHLNLLLSLKRKAQKAGLTSFGSHLWCNHLFGIIFVKVIRRNWVIALQKSVRYSYLNLIPLTSSSMLKQTKITKWMCTKHSTIVLCTLNYASNVNVTDYLYNMKGSK